MSVAPKAFHGWSMSIAQLWGGGPKFTITCGECEATFRRRISMVDNPGVVCPACHTVNVIPVVMSHGEEQP